MFAHAIIKEANLPSVPSSDFSPKLIGLQQLLPEPAAPEAGTVAVAGAAVGVVWLPAAAPVPLTIAPAAGTVAAVGVGVGGAAAAIAACSVSNNFVSAWA